MAALMVVDHSGNRLIHSDDIFIFTLIDREQRFTKYLQMILHFLPTLTQTRRPKHDAMDAYRWSTFYGRTPIGRAHTINGAVNKAFPICENHPGNQHFLSHPTATVHFEKGSCKKGFEISKLPHECSAEKRRWRNFFSLSCYTIFSTFAFQIAIQLRFMPLLPYHSDNVKIIGNFLFSPTLFRRALLLFNTFSSTLGDHLVGLLFTLRFPQQPANYFPVAEPKAPSSKCK